MSIKSWFIRPIANYISNSIKISGGNAVKNQEAIRKELISKAINTQFGIDHNFKEIHSYDDFKEQIPIRNYEGLRSYIDDIKEGKQNVLWTGLPKYFAKTSGTTSGLKYIPVSKDSLPNHIDSARNALLNYVGLSKNSKIFDRKMLFLSGSPKLENINGINVGRLSGIVNHEIPKWVQQNKLPSHAANIIDDWGDKVRKIVHETKDQDIGVISGIPPWVQMYFEILLELTGKATVLEVFPNLKLFIYGGVNYRPYAHSIDNLIGRKIDTLEVYPASEGFIAFQDEIENTGLRLITNSGIFYEFIAVAEYHNEEPERISLKNVKLHTEYVIILSQNAGLWAYNIGDTVRFVSITPYRLIVTGRVKHFISAFGEHVISKEVEEALLNTIKKKGGSIVEFTVAPQVSPSDDSLPYHEWFIEFEQLPEDISDFAAVLDKEMLAQNVYYSDLIKGEVLRPLVVRPLEKGAFRKYMESQGKLGGQNKVPRLMNTRKIANYLIAQTNP